MAKKRQQDPQQYVLPFGWKYDELRQLINRCKFQIPGRQRHHDARLKDFLRLVAHYQSKRGFCRVSVDHFANAMNVAPSTASRVRRLALEMGLVTVAEPARPTKAAALEVNVEAIREHLPGRGVASNNRGVARIGRNPLHAAPCKQQPLPCPPPSVGESNPPPAVYQSWDQVGGVVFDLGVKHAREALSQAQRRGLGLDVLSGAIAHYRAHPGAWGPGALYSWLMGWRPGQGADEGWPAVSAEYRRQRDREHLDAEWSARDAQAAHQRRAAENSDRRYEELEARHGATLDSLGEAECLELLPEDSRAEMRRMLRKAPTMVRLELLRALDNRQENHERTGNDSLPTP